MLIDVGFSIPYPMAGGVVNAQNMQALGFNGADSDAPAGPYMMAQSLRQGYLVRLSDVRLVPFDPRIRVRVA